MTENRPKAEAIRQIENDKVIVTEWRFLPGAETGWHKHGHDYIVTPGMNGRLILETSENVQSVELMEGKSYFRPAGVEHNVVNANDFEFYFVEVELR